MDFRKLCRFCLIDENNANMLTINENIEMIFQSFGLNFEKYNVNGEDINEICDLCWKTVNEFDLYAKRVADIHEMFFKKINDNTNEKMLPKSSEKFYETIEEIRSLLNPKTESVEVIETADVEYDENPIVDVKPTVMIDIKMESDSENIENEMEFVSCEFPDGHEIDDDNENDSINDSDSEFELSETETKSNKKQKIRTTRKKRGRKQVNVPIDDDTMEFILKYVQMKCDICSDDHEYNNYSDVRVHFLEVHNQKAYLICCNRKFTRLGRLLQHCKFHEDPEAFKCSNCEKCFPDKIRLRDHLISMHVPDEECKFQCDQCSKFFAKRHMLNAHIKVKHTENEDRPFACPEENCNRRFVMQTFLRYHVNRVHKDGDARVCDVCARFFKCSKSYDLHYRVQHSNIDQRVQCQECQKWVKHDDALKNHMRRHNATLETCKHCAKTYPGKKRLRVHIRNVHADVDDTVTIKCEYPCPVCGKIFKKKQTLREHMTLHTGESHLYTCTFCTRTFRSSANMYAHRKRSHPKEYQEAMDAKKPQ